MPVIDDLNTFSATDPLSAKQGFILNSRLTPVESAVTSLTSRVDTLEDNQGSGSNSSTTLKIWS